MERKIIGIFVAGGQGTRMQSAIPKQFLLLKGVPVLQRTIERFVEACPGIDVITVLPREHFDTWKELCIRYGFNRKQTLVEGGITRFHSVKNALEKVPEASTVLIHDGVRPLVSVELIREMIRRSGTCRALIPVIPSTDTLKTLETGRDGILHTSDKADPDRSEVFCAQTPQLFLAEDIRNAYRQPFDISFTDDASVARSKNIPLSYIVGERWNLKITNPEDLAVAEKLL